MTTTPKAPTLTVRREIEASADELFDCWLDAESLGSWMRPNDGSGGTRDSTCEVDARVGGGFRIDMHTPTKDIMHHGTYREIDRPRRLVFTWISVNTGEQPSLVTVDFRRGSRPGHTEIVLTHEQLQTPAMVDGHTKGWTMIIENLATRYATR